MKIWQVSNLHKYFMVGCEIFFLKHLNSEFCLNFSLPLN